MPQVSVLGPSLLLIYVNNLPELLNSYLKIFADDAKIVREVKNKDYINLQWNLDKLESWSNTWLRKFNQSKCKVMRMAHSEGRPRYKYYLVGIYVRGNW